jgi:CYTH domain-containing protein
MALEIERKFLVAAAPDPEAVLGRVTLRQGYLALDGAVEVRLREVDGVSAMTVKAGGGRARTEVEVVLGAADAGELWPHAEARSVAKVRARVALAEGLVAEHDVYAGALAGLETVEVEFPDAATADRFVPPAWFGDELTGRPGWSNAELARQGLPPTVEPRGPRVPYPRGT